MGAVLVACLVVLMAIVGLALVLTYQTPSPAQAFSEFFVLGAVGNAENYVSHLQTGVPTELRLGLVNGESEPYHYTVTARLGDDVVGMTQSRSINPGETQEWTISVTAMQAGNTQPLTLELWRDTKAEPYRMLRLWVDITD